MAWPSFSRVRPPCRGERSGDNVLASVDEDRLALDHLRLLAREEGDEAGVVVVRDVAAARIAGGLAGEEGVRAGAEEIAHRLGVERAGGDRVDAHAERGELGRE